MQLRSEDQSNKEQFGAPRSPRVIPESQDALPAGYRLNEFEIVRVLGVGGFGVVYLALDQVLLRYVAVKEYFPNSLAMRCKNAHVEVRSAEAANTFELGLESFINEARLLASFDHPSLVKVHRFWKQNCTAYMVMQYYPGQTLKDARRDMTAPPDERWLRAFMEPLMGALGVLHAHDVFHRDIAPDNILVLPDGQPVILDFGSARRVIGDRTQSLTAVLKPNFSPVEQYADESGMRQGAYTDIFALGGTVRFMLTGSPPVPAVVRAIRDTLPTLASQDATQFPGVSREFLAAIDWTLALAPDDRPQTIAELRQALQGELAPPEPTPRHLAAEDRASTFGPTAALAKTRVLASSDLASPRTISLGKSHAAAAQPDAEPPKTARRSSGMPRMSKQTAGLAAAIFGACVIGLGFSNIGGLSMSSSASRSPPVAEPSASMPLSLSQRADVEAKPAIQPSIGADVASSPGVGDAGRQRAMPAIADHAAAIESNRAGNSKRAASSKVSTTTHDAAAQHAAPAMPAAGTALAACDELGFFAKPVCVSRACASPALAGTPQCVALRRIEENRQQRMER